ncbi:MAG: hypothetical protein IT448_05485 [Phycisphaerales bacterium]|nr:hypothetical protein [Phycisphaerales bacterium]
MALAALNGVKALGWRLFLYRRCEMLTLPGAIIPTKTLHQLQKAASIIQNVHAAGQA